MFINWIGFRLEDTYHSFLSALNIDVRIFPPQFPLTKTGEIIAISEYLKAIAECEKTQVIYLQDNQMATFYKPKDIAYVKVPD